jgi:hypothetical protein
MKHERKQCDGVVTYHSVGSVMAHAVVLNEGGVRGGESPKQSIPIITWKYFMTFYFSS